MLRDSKAEHALRVAGVARTFVNNHRPGRGQDYQDVNQWWLSVNSEDDDDDDDNGKEGALNTQCQCWRQRPWQGRAAAAGPPSQTCPKPLKKEMFIFWCSFQSLSWLQPHTSEKGSRPVLTSQPSHPTLFNCSSLDSLVVSITLMVSEIFRRLLEIDELLSFEMKGEDVF